MNFNSHSEDCGISKQDQRKDQILDAASACFVESGFHNAGMAAIAKRAEMSPGHIYHYFANKSDIIASIVEREFVAREEKFGTLFDVDGEHLIENLLSKVNEGVCHKTDPFQSMLSREIFAETQRNPDIAAIVQEYEQRSRERFIDNIETKLGVKNAAAKVECIFALFSGLAMRVPSDPPMDREAVVEVMKSAIKFLLSDK